MTDELPSKTILGEVKGWTPIIDNLVIEYGLMTAAVFGVIWRHCQMTKGVCTASQERLANILGITRRSVITHIMKLVEAGYLKDETPGIKNKPHVYSDTGKAAIVAQIGVKEIHTSGENEFRTGVNDVHMNTPLLQSLTPPPQKPAAASADTLPSENSKEFSSGAKKSKRPHVPHPNENIEMMWRVWGFLPHKLIIPSLIMLFEKKLGPGGLLDEQKLKDDLVDWVARGWSPIDYTKFFKNHFENFYYMDPQDKLSTMMDGK